MSPYNKDILGLSLNDEGSLFAVAMESGIRVYNTEPLTGLLQLDSVDVGSVSICKLLHRTNLIGLVGGGQRPRFADNTVLIWDTTKEKFVLELTFASRVLSFKMRKDRLFVVERDRIHCFSFPNQCIKLFTVETRDNPLGICDVTPLSNATELPLLVYPGHQLGSVQLLNLSSTHVPTIVNNDILSTSRDELSEPAASVSIAPTNVNAHQSEIGCLTLSRSGLYLATASRKGTLIRIFRTTDNDSSGPQFSSSPSSNTNIVLSPVKIDEFRRGMDPATIFCIAFSPDSEFILASSDKGTVHIYALKESRLNRRSALSAVPLINFSGVSSCPYSVMKFTLPAECPCVCTFGPDRKSVYAICLDGTFHKYTINNTGQDCVRDSYEIFLDVSCEPNTF